MKVQFYNHTYQSSQLKFVIKISCLHCFLINLQMIQNQIRRYYTATADWSQQLQVGYFVGKWNSTLHCVFCFVIQNWFISMNLEDSNSWFCVLCWMSNRSPLFCWQLVSKQLQYYLYANSFNWKQQEKQFVSKEILCRFDSFLFSVSYCEVLFDLCFGFLCLSLQSIWNTNLNSIDIIIDYFLKKLTIVGFDTTQQ